MSRILADSTTFGIVITFITYEIGIQLKKKFHCALFNPLLISIALIIGFLSVFHIGYERYYDSAKYLNYLLTPATVCLAIPLYEQLPLLKKNLKPILFGILSGVLTSAGSVWVFSVLFRFSHQEYVTLLPKSITTAIGMVLSEELGGVVNLTVAAIIVTGILGNISAEAVFRLFRIRDPIAKGLAAGTASHVIGTAKAMELGEVEGAMSSLAIIVSGLCTVVAAPIFAALM